MPITAPVSGDALARGLRSEFRNTWQKRHRGLEQELGSFMQLGISSDKIEELYGYWEVAPYPRRRPWGDEVQQESFRARNFPVENVAWDTSVTWFKHQRLFDQLRDLERAARRAGKNFATLDERVAIQIITGAVDTSLLETIPDAPDGAALFSATDGSGADRFGVSGGNVFGGTGVGTSAAVRTDTFNALERIGAFLDPKGQPANDMEMLKSFTVLFPHVHWQKFLEAFRQTRTVEGSATPTNIVMEGGLQVRLLPTPRLSGPDYYIFSDEMDPKPLFSQVAQPLEEVIETEQNSDIARRTKKEGIFWEAIQGYGVNLPLGAVQVDNP